MLPYTLLMVACKAPEVAFPFCLHSGVNVNKTTQTNHSFVILNTLEYS